MLFLALSWFASLELFICPYDKARLLLDQLHNIFLLLQVSEFWLRLPLPADTWGGGGVYNSPWAGHLLVIFIVENLGNLKSTVLSCSFGIFCLSLKIFSYWWTASTQNINLDFALYFCFILENNWIPEYFKNWCQIYYCEAYMEAVYSPGFSLNHNFR